MMKSPRKKIRSLLVVVLSVAGAASGIWGCRRWHGTHEPPEARLALDAYYPEMPPDANHRYLNLPMDYTDESSGRFRAFYVLSTNFNPKDPVVFFLTDGQMELVGPEMDFSFFDEQLPGVSYVLIGHRGHCPTLFPEVYPDGKLDLRRAMNLYGSWQRIEDIERVRKDMVSAKLLPSDGRIMIFGASGAGLLAQQYLQRYGEHVTRTLLATTGAPDLARQHGWTYARNLAEIDSQAAASLSEIAKLENGRRANLAYMVFQLARQGQSGLATLRKIVHEELTHNFLPYTLHDLHMSLRWALTRTLLSLPAADAVKVRMYELLGRDLQSMSSYGYDLPLYVWSAEVLKNFLQEPVSLPNLQLDRSRYQGEVLVIAGKDDVVFSPAIGNAIASAYSRSRLLLVRGGHQLELDPEYQRAVRRAFFLHGLHAGETVLLLDTPPSGPARRDGEPQ